MMGCYSVDLEKVLFLILDQGFHHEAYDNVSFGATLLNVTTSDKSKLLPVLSCASARPVLGVEMLHSEQSDLNLTPGSLPGHYSGYFVLPFLPVPLSTGHSISL